MSFEAQLEVGKHGERVVARILRERGWYIVPSYDFTGTDGAKAPRMIGQRLGFVIPDLDIARGGTRYWVEVKTKTAADFTRLTQRFEHGMQLRHYTDYQRVQQESASPVWIFVLELAASELLFIALDKIEDMKRVYDGRKMGRGGMVYWPRAAMRVLCRIAQGGTR